MNRNPILYVVLCHSNHKNIFDLFRYIYSSNDIFIFHADSKADINLISSLKIIESKYENSYVLRSHLCSWGGYSLVETLLHAIDESLTISSKWSHFVLLSEYHIPLYSSNEIYSKLEQGVSWIDASRVNKMFSDSQEEIRSRFSMYYDELPGVGPFSSYPRTIQPDIWDTLYHGSQWVVLARNACERISAERKNHTDLMNLFGSSALADETAIPTLLLGTSLGYDLSIKLKNSTYLAWPHVGGLPGMIFTDENIKSAREQDFIFIRKRPIKISSELTLRLEGKAEISAETFKFFNDVNINDNSKSLLRYESISALIVHNFRGLNFEDISLECQGICPTFYIKLTQKNNLESDISINIVSEDLITFKVLIMIYQGNLEMYLKKCGFIMSVIRARVHGLAYNMEIFLPKIPLNGLVCCSGDNFSNLIQTIKKAEDFLCYDKINISNY